MKETIINYIKEKKTTNFSDIFNDISSQHTEFNKNELKTILNELEDEKTVISAFNQIYHTDSLPDHKGVIQWTMNGFCWIDEENKSNKYGITFDIPLEAITIYNKKKALMGASATGKIITNNEKDYFFWLDQQSPKKDIEFVYYVDQNKKCWQLNNSQKMSIEIEDASDEVDSINTALFNHETNVITHKTRLGLKSDKGIETKIVSTLGQLKVSPPNDSAQEEDLLESKDYTKKKFITIDGLYTKDKDDAIALEKTKNGYCLLVAITDVSRYVLPGSKQDIHASEVATSFYLANKTIHMLDRDFAEKKGSLTVGEERHAMVCKMNYDMEGNLKKYSIFPATILCHASLTYDDVNLMLNNKKPVNGIFIEDKSGHRAIRNILLSLNHYRLLKPIVGNRSNVLYNRNEYTLNENGKIQSLQNQPASTDADKIVEDAMLRANMCAAQYLYKNYPEIGLFRNQLVPKNINKPKAATYGEVSDGHWGLGTEFYTHFTSPLRRYCDLVVHIMIKSILKGKKREYSEEKLKGIAKNINIQGNKSKHGQIKETNFLVQQYIEELFNSKKLGKTLTVLDITEAGIVTKNKQNIDYFIPQFKLTREIADKVASLKNDEDKPALIKELNEDYKILGFVDYFNWLDEKKNVTYFMQSKQQLIERQKLKDAKKEQERNQLKI